MLSILSILLDGSNHFETLRCGFHFSLFKSYPTETQSSRLTYRREEALQTSAPELLTTSTVNGESTKTRGEVPNVAESDTRELAAPEES